LKQKKKILEETLPPKVEDVPGVTEEIIEQQKQEDIIQEKEKEQKEKEETSLELDLNILPESLIEIPKEITDNPQKNSEKTPLLSGENKLVIKLKVPDVLERSIKDLPDTIFGVKEEEVKEEKKPERPGYKHELERELDELKKLSSEISSHLGLNNKNGKK